MPMSVWCDWGSWRSYLLLASAFCNGGDSMRQCSNILFSPTDLPVVSVPLVSVPPLFSPSLQYSKVWARRWRHPNTQNHIASHQAWWTSLPAHVDNLATPNISCLCPAGPLHSTHQLVANHPAFWSRPRANLKLRFVRQNTRSSVNIHVIIHKKTKIVIRRLNPFGIAFECCGTRAQNTTTNYAAWTKLRMSWNLMWWTQELRFHWSFLEKGLSAGKAPKT